MNELRNRFFTKAVKVFLAVKNGKYASRIGRDADVVFCVVTKDLELFEEMGLISRKKEGRVVLTSLTPKGRKVQEILCKIMDMLR